MVDIALVELFRKHVGFDWLCLFGALLAHGQRHIAGKEYVHV